MARHVLLMKMDACLCIMCLLCANLMIFVQTRFVNFDTKKKGTQKEPANSGDEINCENRENLDESINEDETNDDEEAHPCDSCDFVFNDIEDLIEHYGETAHNI